MSKPLSLWNDTSTRQAILDFVSAVTTPGSPAFVAPEARIATFDNDGTLWCEKPMYIQFDYFLRELAKVAEQKSELRAEQPWKAAWERDYDWFGASVTKHYQGDDRREYAYRRGAEAALALAVERDWQIISMQSDFRQIF